MVAFISVYSIGFEHICGQHLWRSSWLFSSFAKNRLWSVSDMTKEEKKEHHRHRCKQDLRESVSMFAPYKYAENYNDCMSTARQLHTAVRKGT